MTTHTAPGTTLAITLPTAHALMTGDVTTISSTDTIARAMELMRHLHVRHLPVLDGSRFIGVVDERQLDLAVLEAGGPKGDVGRPVSSLAIAQVPTVLPAADIRQVAAQLRESHTGAVFVVDPAGHLRGIITVVDVLDALAAATPLHPLPGAG